MSRRQREPDFDRVPEFPARFAEPLARAVRGEAAVWPEGMTAEERAAIGAHGMLPMVARLEGGHSRESAIGDAGIETLRLVDLREVLRALAARGAVPIILKGTALAYSLYPEPEVRPRVDVDLLIDRVDEEVVVEAFQSLGFDAPPTSGDSLGYRQRSFVRNDRFGARHVYDVHLDITNNAVTARALDYAKLRGRAVGLPAIGDEAIGLCPVDALLYACIHRAIHHHGTARLVWLYDVHLIRERMSEEQHREFWSVAEEKRLVTICRDTIELAEKWFARASHHGAGEYLTAEILRRPEPTAAFLREGRTLGEVIAGDFAALDWRGRLQRAWQLAFPPASYLMERSGARSRVMLPWLYAVRAVRGVGRLFRRVSGPVSGTTTRR